MIKIEQFCSESRDYLKEKLSPLPEEINPNEINLEDLNNLIRLEETAQAPLQKAQKKVKRLSLWTIGVALSTIVLLSAAALLVLFFPPAAVIIPFFAAIGPWSPLLVLTSLLPSVGLGIASLTALRNSYRIEKQLNLSPDVSKQLSDLVETRNNTPSTSGIIISQTEHISESNGKIRKSNSLYDINQAAEKAPVNEDNEVAPRRSSLSSSF